MNGERKDMNGQTIDMNGQTTVTNGQKMYMNGQRTDDYEKVFNDAVHGSISLPGLCVRIIDTPHFQRLRFLKEVGTAYFVFPAAAHNRFEHCLGVCHNAGRMVRALKSQQPELNIDAKDVLCVQIAGLCHDLGHGPFSHLWEVFVTLARPERKWRHEEASVLMFDHLIEENHLREDFYRNDLSDHDITFIKELIRGNKAAKGQWPHEGRPREKAFLYDIVANNRTGIDVDKCDYIKRDGHSLGITVTFDFDRLIKFSRVIDVAGEGPLICLRDKIYDNVCDLFHARLVLHRTAYQHRVVKTLDTMLIDAFLLADKHIKYRGRDGQQYTLSEACDDMTAYTLLTDSVFHQILLAEGGHPDLLRAKELLSDVLSRRLYVSVGRTQHITNGTTKEDLLASIARHIPKSSPLTLEQLDVQDVRLNYGRGPENPIKDVWFYAKRDVDSAYKRENMSAMLPGSFQEVVFRLVCKSSDEDVFRGAVEAFRGACEERQLKEPLLETWPSDLASRKRPRPSDLTSPSKNPRTRNT